MRREREGRHRLWISFLVFCCSSNMLVCWFCLHSCTSGVRPLFRGYTKMGAILLSLHLWGWCSSVRLYLINSLSQLTFKPKWSSYFHLVSGREEHNCFHWFHTCTEDLRPPGIFLVIFNYRSHSPMTGRSTSALAWLTQVSCLFIYYVFFFLFSFSLSLSLTKK